jgi:uncharacterized pyridoxamine 5'-phosphate oxidase family protein
MFWTSSIALFTVHKYKMTSNLIARFRAPPCVTVQVFKQNHNIYDVLFEQFTEEGQYVYDMHTKQNHTQLKHNTDVSSVGKYYKIAINLSIQVENNDDFELDSLFDIRPPLQLTVVKM